MACLVTDGVADWLAGSLADWLAVRKGYRVAGKVEWRLLTAGWRMERLWMLVWGRDWL